MLHILMSIQIEMYYTRRPTRSSTSRKIWIRPNKNTYEVKKDNLFKKDFNFEQFGRFQKLSLGHSLTPLSLQIGELQPFKVFFIVNYCDKINITFQINKQMCELSQREVHLQNRQA